ncbi:MAG: tRNA 2-selenouridine(34) synthase MnmH [Chloroflexaceae bacterium]|nr:tRNA 2-selenouridine(34) synthase MnmH [Chloroflexaceae bacterium]
MRSPIYKPYLFSETYSEIIDVRSQAEFAEDRIPGAINLPVLNNEERAQVGTLYKQSPFEARKLGAALVSQNISRHLTQHFHPHDKQYLPLIYCWRGGQRSQSLALVLSQIGWSVTVLEGGYKTYRAAVREQLDSLPHQFRYQILGGLTGTGKTEILRHLARQGLQVLDLEAIAHHRGSLLGQEWSEQPEPQPSQKWFESRLLQQLQQFNPAEPVWVESESNKIGKLYLPPALWEQMQQARFLEVQLPTSARVQWLLQTYPHLIAHPDLLQQKLLRLKSRYGSPICDRWLDLIDRQKWSELVKDLLQTHYDPAYRRSISRTFTEASQVISLSDLTPSSIERAVALLQQP